MKSMAGKLLERFEDNKKPSINESKISQYMNEIDNCPRGTNRNLTISLFLMMVEDTKFIHIFKLVQRSPEGLVRYGQEYIKRELSKGKSNLSREFGELFNQMYDFWESQIYWKGLSTDYANYAADYIKNNPEDM